MDGLLTLLLFAGFFFLMMRFGCGAHAMHGGHGAHHEHGSAHKHETNDTKDIDPVCGMQIDALHGYGKMHDAQLYRFCSRACLDKFEADPEKFVTEQKRLPA